MWVIAMPDPCVPQAERYLRADRDRFSSKLELSRAFETAVAANDYASKLIDAKNKMRARWRGSQLHPLLASRRLRQW